MNEVDVNQTESRNRNEEKTAKGIALDSRVRGSLKGLVFATKAADESERSIC